MIARVFDLWLESLALLSLGGFALGFGCSVTGVLCSDFDGLGAVIDETESADDLDEAIFVSFDAGSLPLRDTTAKLRRV